MLSADNTDTKLMKGMVISMSPTDAATLKAACEICADEYCPPATTSTHCLETVDINLLAQKILLLPETDRAMIFLRYCFGFGAAATGSLLCIENPRGRMARCTELLSVAMGIVGSIDVASMEASANRALGRYTADSSYDDTTPEHMYSAGFRRRLNEITSIPHRGGLSLKDKSFKPDVLCLSSTGTDEMLSADNNGTKLKKGMVISLLFVRRIAIAALIAIMMFTTALAASPALREMVFGWVVNTFPKYSQIGAAEVSREPTEADFEILKGYKPEYIPEGYELYQVFEEFSPVIYDYRNGSVKTTLTFIGDIPSESLASYNTEGSTIQAFSYLGSPAFYWEQSDVTYFVWQQDGFQFSVIGEIDKEEALKMADSTKFKKQ